MKPCAHVDEVEDLALGLLAGAALQEAEAHLASCDSCRDEQARFGIERALFAARAPALAPAPFLAPAVLETSQDRRGLLARFVPALIAVAASAAAVTGVTQLQGRAPSIECAPSEGEPPASLSASIDEPLACAQPLSARNKPWTSARLAQRSTDEGLACVVADRVMCEEPLSSSSPSWRVTSSFATP